MKTTVTNSFGLAYDFSGIVLKPGVNQLDDVPPEVLRSMADAGMLVETEAKAKPKAEPERTEGLTEPGAHPVTTTPAVPVPIPPAKPKSEAPGFQPKKPNE